MTAVSVCWAFRRFGTGLYNRRCAVLSNRSSSRISTRRVTGIVRDAVVTTPSARRSCLSAATGVMVGYHLEETELGSPQGGVISPLIANVYLDAFDQFMKARGHRIVRYADDILILCGSRAGAENALRVARRYLENELKLTVNTTKTHIAHSDEGVKFLGVVIHTKYTRIQDKKVVKLKQTLKALTKRNRGIGLAAIIRELNPVLRGFANYFRVANCARVLKQVISWLRRRLRCIQLKQWKKPSRLHRRLKQLGYQPPFRHIKMQSWRNAASPLVSLALPNTYLHNDLKLMDLAKVKTGITVPEFGVS